MNIRYISACIAALGLFAQPTFAQDASTNTSIQKQGVALGVAWEHLGIGNVEFGGKYDYTPFPNEMPLISTNEQQDGIFDGVRIDAQLSIEKLLSLSGAVLNVKGFYAWFSDDSTLQCSTESTSANCDGTPLIDPNAFANNTLGTVSGSSAYKTTRDVQHWGVALESTPLNVDIIGLEPRLGIGYIAIDQDMHLTSTWETPGFGQDYHETLDTGYLGVYWGLSGHQPIYSTGVDFVYGGQAGVYWAHTDYTGKLDETDFGGSYSQHLDLDTNKIAFIGALDVAFKKQVGWVSLAAYARGEYYSYAPQMEYNQTDIDGAAVLIGPNQSTHLDSTLAWDVVVGAAVSMPF